jgi:hypothetical protein
MQVSTSNVWPCLLCGNPLAPTGSLESHPSAPGSEAPSSAWPLGGVMRPRRVVRFARSIERPGRVLGGPAVRAAFGGSLSLSWLPRRVAWARLSPRDNRDDDTDINDGRKLTP